MSTYPNLHARDTALLPLVQEQLAANEAERATEVAEIGKPLKKLAENYIRALNKEKSNAQAAGNITAYEEIEEEIESIRTSADNTGGVPQHRELARLRGIYLDKREEIKKNIEPLILAVDESHSEKLADLVATLTRAGEIEEAKKLQQSIDELRTNIELRRNKPNGDGMTPNEDEHGMIFIAGDRTEGIDGLRFGKHEVTWDEWRQVRDWATLNGYDLKDAGDGISGNHPVTNVSWHDVVKWCNARSERAGLKPVFMVGDAVLKTGDKVPEVDWKADGFRLPKIREWKYAANGGKNSGADYPYSGGTNIDDVGWHRQNSNRKAHRVGFKAANELGLYDMSGNVWEWCWDASAKNRGFRYKLGGSYRSAKHECVLSRYFSSDPKLRRNDMGFRLIRNSKD